MESKQGHRISKVNPHSIADDLGLQPGDRILALDEKPLRDIFDFCLRQMATGISLLVQKSDGEKIIYDIEKDEDEEIGLEFEQSLLDDCTTCHNRCLFCFIDQLPPGMRKSLYIKDDDLRLSFLSGTYVTLTNINDEELDRLISYRFSPMNISVHTTDEKLRRKMMGNKKADGILTKLQRIAAGGIAINAQIVLCPDLNDQAALEKTIEDLTSLGEALQSLAIVPVGLTKYRQQQKLYPLRPLDPDDATAVITLVEKWQQIMLAARKSRVVYASDEIYIKANRPFPSIEEYEDFFQLENGVGMMVQTLDELTQGIEKNDYSPHEPQYIAWPVAEKDKMKLEDKAISRYIMATGTSAAPWLQKMQKNLDGEFKVRTEFMPVANRFFGETVTVAGLVTGQDLLEEFRLRYPVPQISQTILILPGNMFKADNPVMLDDVSVQNLADALGVPVVVCPPTGRDLLDVMAWLADFSREC